MATSHTAIKAALLAIYTTAESSEMDKDTFADNMATVIQDAILSADVDVITPNVSGGGATRPGTGGLT